MATEAGFVGEFTFEANPPDDNAPKGELTLPLPEGDSVTQGNNIDQQGGQGGKKDGPYHPDREPRTRGGGGKGKGHTVPSESNDFDPRGENFVISTIANRLGGKFGSAVAGLLEIQQSSDSLASMVYGWATISGISMLAEGAAALPLVSNFTLNLAFAPAAAGLGFTELSVAIAVGIPLAVELAVGAALLYSIIEFEKEAKQMWGGVEHFVAPGGGLERYILSEMSQMSMENSTGRYSW